MTIINNITAATIAITATTALHTILIAVCDFPHASHNGKWAT